MAKLFMKICYSNTYHELVTPLWNLTLKFSLLYSYLLLQGWPSCFLLGSTRKFLDNSRSTDW